MPKEAIEVKQNPKGNFIYCAGSAIISVLCLLFLLMDLLGIVDIQTIFSQEGICQIFLKLILGLGFLFFGYGFFYFCKRASLGKALLIVNEEGITDYSSAISVGFIPWTDVENIYIDSMLGNEFIEIVLKNEEIYLNRLSKLKKQAAIANKKMGHQIVCITLNSSGISPKELLPQIQEIFEKGKESCD